MKIKKQNFRTEKLFQRGSIQPTRGKKNHFYSKISQSIPCKPMFWGRYDLMKSQGGVALQEHRFQKFISKKEFQCTLISYKWSSTLFVLEICHC